MRKAIVLLAIPLLLACEGGKGPMGPPGPAGTTSKITYQSTAPIPSDNYTVAIPEIIIADMPLVSIYVQPFGVDLWTELPYYFEGYPDWGHMAFITEGHVTFVDCRAFNYKIILIL